MMGCGTQGRLWNRKTTLGEKEEGASEVWHLDDRSL